MNLRGQILLGAVLMAILPLALAIRIISGTIDRRFTELDTARVTNQLAIVGDDLDRQSQAVATLLDALAETITADNRFRLAVSGTRPDLRVYLQDFAPRQMSLMDLDLLQIQDDRGTVLSSGHFPDAHGDMDARLPRLLARAPGGQALINARTPRESFLALGRARPVTLGGKTYDLIGGKLVSAERLRALDRDGDLALAVIWPDGYLATDESLGERLAAGQDPLETEFRLRRDGIIVQSRHLPLVWDGKLDNARLLVTHDRAALRSMIRAMNLRLGLVLLLAAALAVLLAAVLAARVSRPLRELAASAENVDWDRLNVQFQSGRRDEVGRLARLLNEMTQRLKQGLAELRSAEQKATTGEMARQVNHDIRNGLTPLRNVLRHLGEVCKQTPAELPRVYAERQETLDNGLAYLAELATHYARLSPGRAPEPCHLDEVVAAVLADPGAGHSARLVNAVPAGLPPIMADPVSLRRIFDNLVRNALESLPAGQGTVTVDATVERDEDLDEPRIKVSVSDNGEGIAAENLARIFTDFFTTRPQGTGLGLSNVRRLIGDCGGTIRVQSEPDRGTTFLLSFPTPEASRS